MQELMRRGRWQPRRRHHPDGAPVAKRRATSALPDLLRGKRSGGGKDRNCKNKPTARHRRAVSRALARDLERYDHSAKCINEPTALISMESGSRTG